MSPAITRRLVEIFALTRPPATTPATAELTDRERDVLELVARGLSNAEIAARLYIGAATVKTYISRLLTKLDVSTRVHLVIHAYETGLVQPSRGESDTT